MYQFRPNFQLSPGLTPSVAAMYKLSLSDSTTDGIVIQSNTYALVRTQLDEKIIVNIVMKRIRDGYI